MLQPLTAIPPPDQNPSPEILGAPVATVALLVAGSSLAALTWQIVKHFLDGGRVRVYLNAASLEPELMLTTNESGRFALGLGTTAKRPPRARLELAQLVVENPWKVPVTIYSPGLFYKGSGRTKHAVTPRLIATGETMGSGHAITDTLVRTQPYDRVTFLLAYWSVVPGAFSDNDLEKIDLRGYVGVAGRTMRPQLSSRKLRWTIDRDAYTTLEGPRNFLPTQ